MLSNVIKTIHLMKNLNVKNLEKASDISSELRKFSKPISPVFRAKGEHLDG